MAFCSVLRGPALACWSPWEWEGAQYQLSLLHVSRFTLDMLLILVLLPGVQLLALVTSLGAPSPRPGTYREPTLGSPSV